MATVTGRASSSRIASANLTTPRTRSGCQGCRARHLKCDELRPACSRCVKSGIKCIKNSNIRFRHGNNPKSGNASLGKGEFDFSKNQVWCRTARSLSFIDETRGFTAPHDQDSDPETTSAARASSLEKGQMPTDRSMLLLNTSAAASTLSSPVDESMNSNFNELGGHITSAKRRKFDFPPSLDNSLHRSPQHRAWNMHHSLGREVGNMQAEMSPTSSGQEIVLGNIPNVHPGVESSPSQQLSFQVLSNGSETSPHVYFNTPAWPLQDQQEARLLRHFIDNVAPFFDLCDPRRHFQITIPQRTTTCPTLLNAILAASASHLCQFAQFDSLVANFYVQECLQQLLPMMGGVTGMMDENSFAAIVILRFVEELNAPMSSSRHESPRSRLLDTHILANAPTNCIEVSSVQRASYWVCMQQDIYMSFVAQQSTLAPHEFCTADRSVAQADDWTWTKRIMLHCADLLLYCFGEGEHSVGTYDALVRQCADWSTFKPASFHPIFFKEPSMLGVDIFPEVWLLNDAAAAGIQHYHLGMILLTAHNPKAPLVGPDQRQVLKLLDDEIKGHVRIICGIAKSNGTASSPSNWRTATMAISMAGDRFRGRHEQIALMNVLDTTEKKQIWPTNTIKAHIKEAWGWRSV